MCGFGAQTQTYLDANKSIYPVGCADRAVMWIESHLLLVGALTLGLALPQVTRHLHAGCALRNTENGQFKTKKNVVLNNIYHISMRASALPYWIEKCKNKLIEWSCYIYVYDSFGHCSTTLLLRVLHQSWFTQTVCTANKPIKSIFKIGKEINHITF